MAATHVAFLRGINLGKRRVKMAELRSRVEEAGLEEVDTFLASGNVIFRHGGGDPSALEAALEEHLEDALGFATEAFVRPLTVLERLARSEELEDAREDDVVWLRRGGVSDSSIEPRHLQKALGGMDHTMRSLNTVARIAARCGG